MNGDPSSCRQRYLIYIDISRLTQIYANQSQFVSFKLQGSEWVWHRNESTLNENIQLKHSAERPSRKQMLENKWSGVTTSWIGGRRNETWPHRPAHPVQLSPMVSPVPRPNAWSHVVARAWSTPMDAACFEVVSWDAMVYLSVPRPGW